jgi:hypothetical protein
MVGELYHETRCVRIVPAFRRISRDQFLTLIDAVAFQASTEQRCDGRSIVGDFERAAGWREYFLC